MAKIKKPSAQIFFKELYERLTAIIQEKRAQEKEKIETTFKEKEIESSKEWVKMAVEVQSPIRGLEMALAELQDLAKEIGI